MHHNGVCAQHEHVHTLMKALKKCLKYKFLVLNNKVMHENYSRGFTLWNLYFHSRGIAFGKPMATDGCKSLMRRSNVLKH